jgi:hypothetical protein
LPALLFLIALKLPLGAIWSLELRLFSGELHVQGVQQLHDVAPVLAKVTAPDAGARLHIDVCVIVLWVNGHSKVIGEEQYGNFASDHEGLV